MDTLINKFIKTKFEFYKKNIHKGLIKFVLFLLII
jgi:hypothetical protein